MSSTVSDSAPSAPAPAVTSEGNKAAAAPVTSSPPVSFEVQSGRLCYGPLAQALEGALAYRDAGASAPSDGPSQPAAAPLEGGTVLMRNLNYSCRARNGTWTVSRVYQGHEPRLDDEGNRPAGQEKWTWYSQACTVLVSHVSVASQRLELVNRCVAVGYSLGNQHEDKSIMYVNRYDWSHHHHLPHSVRGVLSRGHIRIPKHVQEWMHGYTSNFCAVDAAQALPALEAVVASIQPTPKQEQPEQQLSEMSIADGGQPEKKPTDRILPLTVPSSSAAASAAAAAPSSACGALVALLGREYEIGWLIFDKASSSSDGTEPELIGVLYDIYSDLGNDTRDVPLKVEADAHSGLEQVGDWEAYVARQAAKEAERKAIIEARNDEARALVRDCLAAHKDSTREEVAAAILALSRAHPIPINFSNVLRWHDMAHPEFGVLQELLWDAQDAEDAKKAAEEAAKKEAQEAAAAAGDAAAAAAADPQDAANAPATEEPAPSPSPELVPEPAVLEWQRQQEEEAARRKRREEALDVELRKFVPLMEKEAAEQLQQQQQQDAEAAAAAASADGTSAPAPPVAEASFLRARVQELVSAGLLYNNCLWGNRGPQPPSVEGGEERVFAPGWLDALRDTLEALQKETDAQRKARGDELIARFEASSDPEVVQLRQARLVELAELDAADAAAAAAPKKPREPIRVWSCVMGSSDGGSWSTQEVPEDAPVFDSLKFERQARRDELHNEALLRALLHFRSSSSSSSSSSFASASSSSSSARDLLGDTSSAAALASAMQSCGLFSREVDEMAHYFLHAHPDLPQVLEALKKMEFEESKQFGHCP